jgi:hypothetical protein
LVFLSVLLFSNSYITLCWEFCFLALCTNHCNLFNLIVSVIVGFVTITYKGIFFVANLLGCFTGILKTYVCVYGAPCVNMADMVQCSWYGCLVIRLHQDP